MGQIYKNLYKDEDGRYMLATKEDTRLVVTQESYLLIYILELLLKDKEIMLTPAEKVHG